MKASFPALHEVREKESYDLIQRHVRVVSFVSQ